MITDMHCHFVPGRLLRARAGAGRVRACTSRRAKARTVDLESAACASVSTAPSSSRRGRSRGWTRSASTAPSCRWRRRFNYYLDAALAARPRASTTTGSRQLVARNPARFAAWAFLPMQDPEAAAAELRRCVRDLGFVGGHVASNVRGVYLPDERFRPIFEAAAELDVPLFVHPADPPGKDRTGEYELTVVAGYLFDTTINIFNMICCFPRPLAAPEARLRPYRRLQPDAARAHAVRGRHQSGLSRTLPRTVGDYLRTLYFDTVCFEPAICGSPPRSCRSSTSCWAAMRRFRSASRTRSISCAARLPPEQAELVLSQQFRPADSGDRPWISAASRPARHRPRRRRPARAVAGDAGRRLRGDRQSARRRRARRSRRARSARRGARRAAGAEALALLRKPPVAYGKAAIVGLDGDIEHAAAILHPRMGKPMRDAIGGGQAIIPSNVKMAAAGASIDVPLATRTMSGRSTRSTRSP